MNRLLPFVVLFAACQPGTGGISVRNGELVVANAPIDDLGTFPVGVPSFVTVRLNAERASVPVTAADLTNPDGVEKVFYTISEFLDAVPDAELPEGITEVTGRIEIGVNGEFDYPLVYWPLDEGHDRAEVAFTFLGIDDTRPKKIELRARADTPAASVYPRLVDCGKLDVGQTRKVDITVENRSALPLVMGHVIEPAALFSSLEPNPFQVPPGSGPYAFTVDCTPLNELPAQGSAKFQIGNLTIATVALQMNNCENGVPAAYDRDGDGFTSCGGDCDDENAQANPTKDELPDGADNDCNGKIDDNTRGYDDDGDGYCEHPTSCLGGANPGDCNDGDDRVNPGEEEEDICPGADEVCSDGIDNDCLNGPDGGTDDNDGDGYSESAGDCDDTNDEVYPGAPELPDRLNNDCDLETDEGTRLYDDDGDGYCEGIPGTTGCTVGAGTGDCNDSVDPNSLSNPTPGASAWPDPTGNNEIPDRIDNDCDGLVDEGTRYDDVDGDGYTEAAGDCGPLNPDQGPHMLEIPNNGIDDDCDVSTPVTGPR